MGCLQWLCQGVTVLGSTRLGRRHRLTFIGFNIPTNYFSTQAAQALYLAVLRLKLLFVLGALQALLAHKGL